MQNALLVGLSRQMALSHELDVIANNLANVDTTGFKADKATFSEFLMPGARDNEFATGKDRRVSFVQDRATWIDFSPGAVQQTGSPLDVTIDGSKGWLVVQTPRGQRYTRSGSLSINATGTLVTSEGDAVQGTGGSIQFQTGDHNITISGSGIITAQDSSGNSAPRGQLQLVTFDRPHALQKDGGSMFLAPNGVNSSPAPAGTRVVQGQIEKSNVNAVAEMARMIQITRNYSDIAAILQQQGDLKKNSMQQLAQAPSSSN
jgi:flagellar basal-body rod protein FlgF